MNKLELKNFKAHKELKISFDNKNFLLYGDNGAGKSSIYEALKLVFYKDRVEKDIPKANTEEVMKQNQENFYAQYNNKNTPNDFTITFNTTPWKNVPRNTYDAYLLTLEDMYFERTLDLKTLLERVFFPSHNVEKFKRDILWGDTITLIQTKANEFLRFCQEETTQITIDTMDNDTVRVSDTMRGLENTKEIKKYFNEAKINLVILALLFSAIEVTKEEDKKNILILDDFITSLDMSNRTFLMRYILETFKEFQIVILTHNVYFYNLIMYLVKDIYQTKDKWQFANLYEIGNEHKIYLNNIRVKVEEIKTEYDTEAKKTSPNFTEIGNKLRQKFERLLYELSKILMVGGVEESNKILEHILNQENIYLFKYEEGTGKNKKIKFKDVNRLLDDLVSNPNDVQKVQEYKLDTLPAIQEILRTLKLYRKVSMHSLSHGQVGQHNWSDKEIKQTLILLTKLETNIKDLRDKQAN